ncbi:MAG: hypothetical protein IJL78_05245 [Lachnospiraceae bacterium]|nr:hypothetical protein [Lachnospiraceae bacterium]
MEQNYPGKTILTWVCPEGSIVRGSHEVYNLFNELLDEKGYDFVVNFVQTKIDPKNHLDYIKGLYGTEAPADIFNTGFLYKGDELSQCILLGMCEPLDPYLDSEAGERLKNMHSDVVWTSVSDDGTVYGVPCNGYPFVQSSYAVNVNMELAEKYGISVDRLFSDTVYLWECAETVARKEKELGNNGFRSVLWLTDTNDLLDYLVPDDIIVWKAEPLLGFRVDDGKVQTVNLLEDERISAAVSAFSRFRKSDRLLIEYPGTDNGKADGLIDSGQYFVAFTDRDVELPGAVTHKNRLRLQNREGSVNCIASWRDEEHKQAAFRLLAAVQTDPELSNLLAYGVTEKDYTVENGKVIPLTKADGSRTYPYLARYMLTNTDVLMPDQDDIRSPEITDEDITNALQNPLFGRRVDRSLLRDQEKQIYKIRDYYEMSMNSLEDPNDIPIDMDSLISALKNSEEYDVLKEIIGITDGVLREMGMLK